MIDISRQGRQEGLVVQGNLDPLASFSILFSFSGLISPIFLITSPLASVDPRCKKLFMVAQSDGLERTRCIVVPCSILSRDTDGRLQGKVPVSLIRTRGSIFNLAPLYCGTSSNN